MATSRNFFKQGGSYYFADNNQKILNLQDLQAASRAGGIEVQATPQNLAQFVSPAQANTNPANGSASPLPNLGQSTMGAFFNDKTTTGLTLMEQSIMSYADQQQKLNEEKKLAAQNQYDQAYAGMESAYNQPSGLELMKTLMAEQGIQDKQNQLSEFQKQLANLQNEFTNANNAIGSQPINTAIIRGQQYQKQLEFASKATLIQSQAAVVEGQLNFAKDLVQGYYDAATTDRQNQISRYQTLLKLADDKLVNLAADEKDNLNMMISTLQSAETRQQENKDKISDLLLDPVAAAAWSKTPGLSLDMDYGTFVQKLLPQIVVENTRLENLKNVKSSGGSGGSAVKPYQSALDKSLEEYAYQAISLEKYGTKAEKDSAFANLVNAMVTDSAGAMTYNSAQQALIQKMQELKGETVNYNIGSDIISTPTPTVVPKKTTIKTWDEMTAYEKRVATRKYQQSEASKQSSKFWKPIKDWWNNQVK